MEEETEGCSWKFFYFLFLSDKYIAVSHNNKTTTKQPSVKADYDRNIKKVVQQRNLSVTLQVLWPVTVFLRVNVFCICLKVFWVCCRYFFLTYASQGEVFKRTRLDCALSIPMKSDITMINTQQLLPSSTSPKAFNVSWPWCVKWFMISLSCHYLFIYFVRPRHEASWKLCAFKLDNWSQIYFDFIAAHFHLL